MKPAALYVLPVLMASMSAQTTSHVFPDVQQLELMASRFTPTTLAVDVSHLSAGDRKALTKMIEAGYVIDEIFLHQLWSGDAALQDRLKHDRTALGRARYALFSISKSPWYPLDDHRAFIGGVPERKLPGANFYPEDMSREDFERWIARLPHKEAESAQSFFTVIRGKTSGGGYEVVPYREAYRPLLEQAAQLLRDAASLTDNASLQHFLRTRAAAFLTDDYFESDVAWMDMDAPIDLTIGPYETYNDELFGYKASFEAYVCLKDEQETEKLKDFTRHLQEVENSLPLDARFKNPKLGSTTPIRVVNEVLSAGDGNHGVQTAAYNLPNDERVVLKKGSKKVMLKNVQHAKFDSILLPISRVVLPKGSQHDLSFEWFFTHILAHELSHGIGPQETELNGKKTSVRLALKDTYSAIEEAKADITGLFMLQLFFDRGFLPGGEANERKLYTTFLASAFRTLRFGTAEAHGLGMAVQMNFLLDHGAFVQSGDGRFEVHLEKMKAAVRDLTGNLLAIEASGDYNKAKSLLTQFGVLRPEIASALHALSAIPVDIKPVFTTANELAARPS